MILTPKVDVYCFGVQLLELIHGEYLDDMVSSCQKKESNWSFDFSKKKRKKKKQKKKYSFADEDVLDQRPSASTELEVATSGKLAEQVDIKGGDSKSWSRVPYLPSYVPFGQVYIMNSCFIYFSVCFSFVCRRLFLPEKYAGFD